MSDQRWDCRWCGKHSVTVCLNADHEARCAARPAS